MGDLDINALKDTLVGSIKSRWGEFLAENADAAALVERVGRDYASLTIRYYLANDDEAKGIVLAELRRVENTLALEEDAIAEASKAAIFATIKDALGAVLNFATSNLPLLLAAFRK